MELPNSNIQYRRPCTTETNNQGDIILDCIVPLATFIDINQKCFQ